MSDTKNILNTQNTATAQQFDLQNTSIVGATASAVRQQKEKEAAAPAAEKPRSIIDTINAQTRAKFQQADENAQMYGVYIEPRDMPIFQKMIDSAVSNGADRETAVQDIQIGMMYSKKYKISLAEAIEKKDILNEITFQKQFTNVSSNWQAVKNAVKGGFIQQSANFKKNQWLDAFKRGDTELMNALTAEIEYLEEQVKSDNIRRNPLVAGAISAGSSVAYSGTAALLTAAGTALGVGGTLAAAYTAYSSRGEMAYNLCTKMGVSPQIADIVASTGGAAAAFIEQGLSPLVSKSGKAVNALLGDIPETALKKAMSTVGQNTVLRLLIAGGKDYIADAGSEALEEVAGGLSEDLFTAIGCMLDGVDVPQKTKEELQNEIFENAKGGFWGKVFLGLPADIIITAKTAAGVLKVRKAATSIPSEAEFKRQTANAAIFDGMDEQAKASAQSKIYSELAGVRNAAQEQQAAADLASVTDASENAEKPKLDSEGNELEKEAAFRKEDGKLYSDVVNSRDYDDGSVSADFVIGDGQSGKRYGRIPYKQAGNKITIEGIKTASGRHNLAAEMYADFAEKFSGMEIEWNATSAAESKLKRQLAELNPRGRNAGLNYFLDGDIEENRTRIEIAQNLKSHLEKVGNKNISSKEISSFISLMDTTAHFTGGSLSELSKRFVSGIFSETNTGALAASLKENALAQESTDGAPLHVGGYTTWQEIDGDLKALIHVSEYGNFSTLVHEYSHALRRIVPQETLAEIEKAFSTDERFHFDAATGWTAENEEIFAETCEKYFMDGANVSPELQPLMQRIAQAFAQFVRNLQNALNLSPEIKSVLDTLYQNKDGVLSKADYAVQQAEAQRRNKAQAKKQAAEKAAYSGANDTEQSSAENAAATETAEEAAEPQTVEEVIQRAAKEEAPVKAELAAREKEFSQTVNRADVPAGLKASLAANLTAAQNAAQNAESAVTGTQSAAVTQDDTGKTYINGIDENLFFQIIGERGIKNLIRAQSGSIKENAETAQRMKEAANAPQAIYDATGFEFDNARGSWRYELDDSAVFIKDAKKFNEQVKRAAAAEYTGDTAVKTAALKELSGKKLSDVIDFPELFTAYPRLSDMGIAFIADKTQPFVACLSTDFAHGGIVINTVFSHTKSLECSLLHELQHYIQHDEGVKLGYDTAATREGVENKDAETVKKSGYKNAATEVNARTVEARHENKELRKLAPSVAEKAVLTAEAQARLDSAQKKLDVAKEDLRTNGYSAERRAAVTSAQEEVKEKASALAACRKNEITAKTAANRVQVFYQIIGETGAKALKESAKFTNIMTNLQLAQRYNTIRPARDILKSTGWNLDTNVGKWKYELSDDNATIRDKKRVSSLIAQARGAAATLATGKKELAAAALKARNESLAELNRIEKLSDLLDFPELFTAYPKLAQHTVSFVADTTHAYRAAVNKGNPVINTVFISNADELTSSLLHEVQHSIQTIEGVYTLDYNTAAVKDALIKSGAQYEYDKESVAAAMESYRNAQSEIEARNVQYRRNNPAAQMLSFEESAVKMLTEEKAAQEALQEKARRAEPAPLFQTVAEPVDLTAAFTGKPTAQEVENYLNSLLNKAMETATNPLQVQVVSGNKNHVKTSSIRLKGKNEQRHNAALVTLEKIINNAVKNNKSGIVDLTHNTKEKTLKHKEKIAEYVYFDSPVKIGGELYTVELVTERLKERIGTEHADLLDLYNVSVKKSDPLHANLIASVTSRSLQNIPSDSANVNQTRDEYKQIEAFYHSFLSPKVQNRYTFYQKTFADWKETETPQRKSDYTSASGSKYWYEKDGVYRNATHWGHVASTLWTLDGKFLQAENFTNTKTGYAKWEDFQKKEIPESEDMLFRYKKMQLADIEEFEAHKKNSLAILRARLACEGDFMADILERQQQQLEALTWEDLEKYQLPRWYERSLEDSEILLFQTLDSSVQSLLDETLIKEAQTFDSWTEFMEYEETMNDVTAPDNTGAEWYKTLWEKAHGIKPEIEQLEEQVQQQDKADGERGRPDVIDSLFLTEMRDDEKLLPFLKRLGEIFYTQDDTGYYQPQDEEEKQQYEKDLALKKLVQSQFRHGDFVGQSAKLMKGGKISETKKRSIRSLLAASPRDYRDLYAQIMGDEQYAVAEEDKTINTARKKLASLDRKEPEDLDKLTPNQRAALVKELDNAELAAAIKDGSYKLDDKLDNYVRTLESDLRAEKKKLDKLKDEYDTDYRRISDWETRELLRAKERLEVVKAKLENRKIRVKKSIDSGVKLASRYEQETRQLKADYDTVFKKFSDLSKVLEATGEAKALMLKLETLTQAKENYKEKKRMAARYAAIKKMRTQLVKRIMRRVPFERVDYEAARKTIAVQMYINDWIKDGVNSWIGQSATLLRSVWSGLKTDSDYRAGIFKYLQSGKQTKSKKKCITLLEGALASEGVKGYEDKPVKRYEDWTSEERSLLYKLLPREDWVRELRLDALQKERDESIQLKDETGRLTKEAMQLVNEALPPTLKAKLAQSTNADGAPVFNQPVKSWTLSEMEELAAVIDKLYTDGRDTLAAKNELRRDEQDKLRLQVLKEIKKTGIQIEDGDSEELKAAKLKKIAQILGTDSAVKGTLAARGEKNTLKNRMRAIDYATLNMRRVAQMLDNDTDGGINTNLLYWRENDCFNTEERAVQERRAKIEDVMSGAGISIDELFSRIEVKNFTATGESHFFTVDELLYIDAAMQDEQSRAAVVYGNLMDEETRTQYRNLDKAERDMGGIAKGEESASMRQFRTIAARRAEAVTAAAAVLPEKYRALKTVIQNDYAENYEKLNRASIEEFNQPVRRVKNYVPLVRLESSGETNNATIAADLIGAGNPAASQYVGKGMTQKRVEISPVNQKPVQLGLYSTWADSLQRNEHFIAYSGYVRDLNRIYKSRDALGMRDAIQKRYGQDMVKYIDSYIETIANPQHSQMSGLDRIIRTLRGKTAPAYLAWKMSGIVKQLCTSPFPSLQYCEPLEYAAAAFECMKPQTVAEIRETSPFMNTRRFTPILDLLHDAEEKATTPVKAAIAKFNSLGMQGLEAADWVCVAPLWLATYKKQLAKLTHENNLLRETLRREEAELAKNAPLWNETKTTEEQVQEVKAQVLSAAEIKTRACAYADDCVRKCQPSSRAVDLAPLFRNNGAGSEAAKMLLQFQTALNVIYQNLRYDLPQAIKQKQFKQVLNIAGGYAVAGIAVGLVTGGLPDDDDDDPLAAPKQFLFYSMTQFTDSVPVIGSTITAAAEKMITGKAPYRQSNLFPALQTVTNGIQAAGAGEWQRAASQFAQGVGYYLGLPVSGIKEVSRAAGVYDDVFTSGGDGKAELQPAAFIGRQE